MNRDLIKKLQRSQEDCIIKTIVRKRDGGDNNTNGEKYEAVKKKNNKTEDA